MHSIKFILKSDFKLLTLFVLLALLGSCNMQQEKSQPFFEYTVNIDEPASHTYHVTLNTGNWETDTLELKMPVWMPGYYQIMDMDYAGSVKNVTAKTENGRELNIRKSGESAWIITDIKGENFTVNYSIETKRRFVANSIVDEEHAYIIPGNTFLYVDGYLDLPVSVTFNSAYRDIATGLEKTAGKSHAYTATNFDILYDCPILAADLDTLPSFKINGVEHRFAGYKMGDFDKKLLMDNLHKAIDYATGMMEDIPYKEYTFIGIGPGMGGIEHLNNTTVSFNGNNLNSPREMNRMLNFLVHEYFHNYNVKRIRPYELGPFDYSKANRTNQLWISEGLTVYYEYMIMKRSGLADKEVLFANFEEEINATENDPGRFYQSLAQSSYYTWEDGPFGTPEGTEDRSITYYEKGPVVGLLLDFTIRYATQNQKSLDDVMRYLYRTYYKQKQRGFTEAEMQEACESIAGRNLSSFFEYIYTTKEPDYITILGYAGLYLEKDAANIYRIKQIKNPNQLQTQLLQSWLSE